MHCEIRSPAVVVVGKIMRAGGWGPPGRARRCRRRHGGWADRSAGVEVGCPAAGVSPPDGCTSTDDLRTHARVREAIKQAAPSHLGVSHAVPSDQVKMVPARPQANFGPGFPFLSPRKRIGERNKRRGPALLRVCVSSRRLPQQGAPPPSSSFWRGGPGGVERVWQLETKRSRSIRAFRTLP